MLKKDKRSNYMAIAYIFTVLLLASCSTLQSPDDMSPTDVAIWANRTYVMEYDTYVHEINKGNLTPLKVEALRKKRQILTDLYPYLMTLNTYIESGTVPEQEITEIVIDLVYKLTDGM